MPFFCDKNKLDFRLSDGAPGHPPAVHRALTALRVYDNSAPADPASGKAPSPVLVLHAKRGKIMNREDLAKVPEWAKPMAAAAMKVELKR